jgi:hypothetical protein
MALARTAPLHFGFLDGAEALNREVVEGFERWVDDPSTRRTHRFGGRYENVYIDPGRIPALGPVLTTARRLAAEALGLDRDALHVGFWFNAMEPGERTLAHSHDDADELLSGVYYVAIPPESGELVIAQPHSRTHVAPRPGMFVFFPPDLVHEVTENRSSARRLSIGLNVGPKRARP